MTQPQAAPRHLDIGVRYVPIAGTFAWGDGWVIDDNDPFTVFMNERGFRPIRAQDGRPFRWSTNLAGLLPWRGLRDWEAGGDALAYFLEPVPYADRNLIAHSHGGQPPAFAAASGVKIRSLTTVGTPVRTDVPWDAAEPNIGRHVHVYDETWDWMGWLGAIGDSHISGIRYFANCGVYNVGLKQIDHSKILRDRMYFHFWDDAKLLALIVTA